MSLLVAVEESTDIDRPARVTAYEEVGITICCNMLVRVGVRGARGSCPGKFRCYARDRKVGSSEPV